MTIHALPVTSSAPHTTFAPTLSEEDARHQATLLKALSDPTRLRILSLLSRHEGDISVFEIVECFNLEQPTISHHLAILRTAGLVDFRKRGLFCLYFVKHEMHDRVCAIVDGVL